MFHAHEVLDVWHRSVDLLIDTADRSPQSVHRIASDAMRASDIYKDAHPALQPKLVVALHNLLLAVADDLPCTAVPAQVIALPEPEPPVDPALDDAGALFDDPTSEE